MLCWMRLEFSFLQISLYKEMLQIVIKKISSNPCDVFNVYAIILGQYSKIGLFLLQFFSTYGQMHIYGAIKENIFSSVSLTRNTIVYRHLGFITKAINRFLWFVKVLGNGVISKYNDVYLFIFKWSVLI